MTLNRDTMRAAIFTSALLLAASAAPLHADVVGFDPFAYSDGAIVNQAGGTFFDYDNTSNHHTGTVSDFEGNATVTAGRLVTENTNAFREYNGPGEGGTDEMLGAFRAVGVVYYTVEMTRTEGQGDAGGNTWGGISSYDFGTERIFFGVRSGQGATQNFGLQIGAAGVTGSIAAINNITYTVVAAVDFDDDQVRLWVNPDGGDYDYRDGGTSADMTLAYTGGNWSSEFRLASASDARTEWDNVRVATTFAEANNKNIVFADNFSEANGTLLHNKAPDAGGASWNVTVGSGDLDIQLNTVDTTGQARTAFGFFTRALGQHETLVLDFETLDTAGNMFSGGFAGISLFEGNTERVFIGDASDSTTWALRAGGFTGTTANSDESIVGKFVYDFDSGEYMFLIDGLVALSGVTTSGYAIDGIRFANNNGGDIAISDLVVSFIVPAPAALPAGLGLLSLLTLRRRRTVRAA